MTEDDITEQFVEGEISIEEYKKLLRDLGVPEKTILYRLRGLKEIDVRLE